MALRIHTNLYALSVRNHLQAASDEVQARFRHLSTGLRIASAADDPAGLAISERMRAQVRSLSAAARNVQDGVSLVQTAEGALGEFSGLLVRARELIVAANNGTQSATDRQALDAEYQGIAQELGSIARSTNFNGIALLSANGAVQIAAGAEAGDTIDVGLDGLPGVIGAVMGLFHLDTGSGRRISELIVDFSVDYVSGLRARFGAAENRLSSSLRSLMQATENLSSAESRVRDADIAAESAGLLHAQLLQQAGLAVLAQANLQPALALRLLQPPPGR